MLKIRASQVGKIMPGKKSDWLKGTETYLFELWVQEKYGREKDIKSKYLEKGTKQEEEAITLLYSVTGDLYFKNEKHFENEWITGTPDIIKPDFIRDLKCPWDVFSFEKQKAEGIDRYHNYYWQLMSYMDLTGTDIAYLDYCLVDTPENLIEREQYYLERNEEFTDFETLKLAREELRQSMMYADIPNKDRVHTIKIKRNEEDINLIHERVEKCRKFYKENFK